MRKSERVLATSGFHGDFSLQFFDESIEMKRFPKD